MRKLILLLSAFLIGATLLLSGIQARRHIASTTRGTNHFTSPAPAATRQDPPGTIDGSVNPQLIPDDMAYVLFFNFFSNRSSSERGKLQSYCNQTALATVNLDSILAAATYYQELVAPINAQAQAIRDSHSSHKATDAAGIIAQLAPLQAQREAVLGSVIAKLPDFVGLEGAVAIRNHIDQRIKAHTKIFPGPNMQGDGIMPAAMPMAPH